jgi:hypothetical protein
MKGRRMKSSRLSSDIARPVSHRTLLLSMQSERLHRWIEVPAADDGQASGVALP